MKIYKFNSFWFELRQELTVIERETYSLLEWLGDVVGLFDGLKLIFKILIVPLTSFALKAELLSEIWKSKKKASTSDRPGK